MSEHLAVLARIEELEYVVEAVKEVVASCGQAVRDVVAATQSGLGEFDERLTPLEAAASQQARLGRRVAQLTDAVATHLVARDPALLPPAAHVRGADALPVQRQAG
jgi:hypothetical protein